MSVADDNHPNEVCGRQDTTARKEFPRQVTPSGCIHDTARIAAAFCMYNRHVDGFATFAPTNPDWYAAPGKRIVEQHYGTT